MQKPKDWEATEAYTGDSEALPAGAYVCKILGAREELSKTGAPMLVLCLDIAPGEPHAGYFSASFEFRKKQYADAKWPNGGIYRQFTTNKTGTCNEWFKGLIQCIEASNQGFHFDFNEKTLAGKLFGGIFRREQYEATDGSLKFATKCFKVTTAAKVREGIEPPEDKLLSGSSAPSASAPENSDFVEVSGEDDLPF